jgi:DNA-binding MarR family transcriptional regulator
MSPEGRDKEIRRLADKSWYWVSKSVLSRYGKILKSSGIAVYSVLAYFSNSKTQTCFPSQAAIGKLMGLSRQTVNKKIAILRKLGLICCRRQKNHLIYFLLRNRCQKNQGRCLKRDTGDVPLFDTNNNKLIKINNKNNGTDGFNNLKPLRRLLKRYDQRRY